MWISKRKWTLMQTEMLEKRGIRWYQNSMEREHALPKSHKMDNVRSTTNVAYNQSERGGDMKDTVIAVNSLNVEKAFEALARILTARGEATVTVKSIKKKDEVQKDETA